MKILRKIIKIDEELCDGCGQCVPSCDEGAIQIIDGKARVVAEKYCDGLGACLGDCPQGAISIEERMADDFDPEAVEEYLKNKAPEEGCGCGGEQGHSGPDTLACGCPSTQMQTLASSSPGNLQAINDAPAASALGHWPVQIRLIPAHAPFLKDADLLILADCAAVAYASLHQKLLADRVVMMGCPKFDDQQMYVDRFTELFKTRKLNSVTILIMEVPCCSSMLQIVKKAYDEAGATVEIRQVVISTQGQILNDQTW